MALSCLKNLSKCNASCCRSLPIFLSSLTTEQQEFYKRHGCKILQMNPHKWLVQIPLVCTALSSENLCSLHGTDKKPLACQRLDENHYKNYLITENCLLEDKEGIITIPDDK